MRHTWPVSSAPSPYIEFSRDQWRALASTTPLPLTQAEAGTFAHGQAPRRSRAQLAQWAAEVGHGTAGDDDASPIAATAPSGDVLGLLRIDGTRLRTVLVF